ncbi:MAG: peptidase M14 [Clostridiaceae bacterium]|nr:peptidase M14 [Clostridiaceae bacterium]
MDFIYDYQKLCADITKLSCNYPFIKLSCIGKSNKHRKLHMLQLGNGKTKVLYNGTHHGLEWITSAILMKFVFDYAKSYITGTRLYGFDIRKLYENASIYIVPMVNPDGVEISKTKKKWQANSKGVDLNHNYNAGWQQYKALAAQQGITKKCATRYPGKGWESEPESSAIVNFTRIMSFDYVVALHSQGKEIYWQYGNIDPPKAEKIGKLMSEASGYALIRADGLSSYSGYKDWFIKEFNRPGFTIEVGEGKNPLPYSCFDKVYNEVVGILLLPGEIYFDF